MRWVYLRAPCMYTHAHAPVHAHNDAHASSGFCIAWCLWMPMQERALAAVKGARGAEGLRLIWESGSFGSFQYSHSFELTFSISQCHFWKIDLWPIVRGRCFVQRGGGGYVWGCDSTTLPKRHKNLSSVRLCCCLCCVSSKIFSLRLFEQYPHLYWNFLNNGNGSIFNWATA